MTGPGPHGEPSALIQGTKTAAVSQGVKKYILVVHLEKQAIQRISRSKLSSYYDGVRARYESTWYTTCTFRLSGSSFNGMVNGKGVIYRRGERDNIWRFRIANRDAESVIPFEQGSGA